MNLYCKVIEGALIVLAVHSDSDGPDPSAYGEGVLTVPYSGDAAMSDLIGHPAPVADLLGYARAKRWAAEVGGVTYDGARYATDDRSKLLISGAVAAAGRDSNYATPWFTADGAVKVLNAAGIVALSTAVLDHVNDTFKVLANVAAGIAASPPTVTTLAAIDEAFAALHD